MDNDNAIKVYLVEDSAPVRARLKTLIQSVPRARVVGEADTPAAAIAGIRNTHPRLVILDVHLIGGCGLDVLTALRGAEPGVVVVVVTNVPTVQYRSAYMR